MRAVVETPEGEATPLHVVTSEELDGFLDARSDAHAAFARACGFKAGAGELLILPDADGAPARIVLGAGKGEDVLALGAAPLKAPVRDYVIASAPEGWTGDAMAIAWELGAYQFEAYKAADRKPARLVAPEGADLEEVGRVARAVKLVRDLVNTPAGDMGPEALEAAAREMAKPYGASVKVTTGDKLLKENYPAVHAVGRAAHEAPRMIEIEWGEKDAPKDRPRLAIVGKGVCFDTGGLNIKTGDFMRLMKKDMGGAAHALGLAQMVMDAKLPVTLHVAVPAVENAISADAFRPGDVLKTRAGLTVEVENTDAEGRLVLADGLARVIEDEPDLVVDFATLTGAARVAVGAEIAPFFTNEDKLAAALEKAAAASGDPVWRLPLWAGYDRQLESPIADLKNLGNGAFAGSIMAALFLQRFVKARPWIHLDVFAWNPNPRPARPAGGDAHALRAVWEMLKARYR
ncbi:MAG: leucyl aminopeptidase family protein [Maricaulaceae bacterium]|jgi:leucyl aminopeptidase